VKLARFSKMKFDEAYWSDKYKQQNLGWDAGSVTTPIKEYIDQLTDKRIRILVPGCGNGHEVEYLHNKEFDNVKVIDISAEPFNTLIPKCPNWPDESFIIGDFFNHYGAYDLIIEQTFFCSLNPNMRQAYANKMYELLAPQGKLAGVLFNISLGIDNPPFGGTRDEYIEYFRDGYSINVFDKCYNSISPRAGAELFINLQKQDNLNH
jgi:SAM-dependent methyltransferase